MSRARAVLTAGVTDADACNLGKESLIRSILGGTAATHGD
jgi:hypothetical protein